MSARQGPHHVAQKSNTTGRPWKSASRIVWPSSPRAENAGATWISDAAPTTTQSTVSVAQRLNTASTIIQLRGRTRGLSMWGGCEAAPDRRMTLEVSAIR
jgi:hypothetical protein